MGLRSVLFSLALASLGAVIFLFAQNSIVINYYRQAINADIVPQSPLANPPKVIKALYATSWSAGSEKKLTYLIDLINKTELNAAVIDIKDFSGFLAYNTDLELPKKYDAVELRIPKLNTLIKRLHDHNIYAIARIAVFQDPRLALARPEIALISSSTGRTWKDSKGLMWIDPAAKDAWDYNVAIAKEALARGFDEVNFDYVRFASDGNLGDIRFPIWDGKTLKTKVIRDFFAYLHQQIPNRVSVDLFGLVMVNTDGLGIGQHLEFALPDFDAIAPMVYPSHYYAGFIGYKNPAEAPYEVIRYSMDRAVKRLRAFQTAASTTPIAKLRPWIQDFDLGARYDAEKVRAEIRAWDDAASGVPELYGGWMLWNPANVYTAGALQPEPLTENQ